MPRHTQKIPFLLLPIVTHHQKYTNQASSPGQAALCARDPYCLAVLGTFSGFQCTHAPRPLHACSLAINKSLITNLLYHVSSCTAFLFHCVSGSVSLLLCVSCRVHSYSFISAFHSASSSVQGARSPLNISMSSVVVCIVYYY